MAVRVLMDFQFEYFSFDSFFLFNDANIKTILVFYISSITYLLNFQTFKSSHLIFQKIFMFKIRSILMQNETLEIEYSAC